MKYKKFQPRRLFEDLIQPPFIGVFILLIGQSLKRKDPQNWNKSYIIQKFQMCVLMIAKLH